MRRPPLPSAQTSAHALSGVLAAVAGMAVGHLVASLRDPAYSPVLAVGSAVIDATPTPVKEWAVAHFGTHDKPILLASVTLVTVVLAAVAGALSRRRLGIGIAFVLVLVALAAGAALLRPTAGVPAVLPALVTGVVGVTVLVLLVRSLRRAAGSGSPSSPTMLGAGSEPTRDRSRRGFLIGAAGVSVGAVVAGAAGQRLASRPIDTASVRLPAPAETARPLPKGLEVTVKGVSDFRTPTADFYRVDTNLSVPKVRKETWSLQVDGDVQKQLTLSFDELAAMPLIERDITMTCVSNEVGGSYIGSARWLGVRLTDVLDRAGITGSPDQLLSTAVDGFTISTPLEVVRDGRDAMIAIGMNGQPLTEKHGFPARLITPGLYGFVGATKWLTRLTLTTYAAKRAYWTERDWAIDAPIKTSARVDTPRPLSTVPAGRTAIGGVAWAQHRGVRKVEVRVDGGPWQGAMLGPDAGIDYWRQWYLPWDATTGQHTIAVRAVDGTGATQVDQRATPFPAGSSGIQEIVVIVA